MGKKRLKVDSKVEEACYHCISRTTGEQWLLKGMEKEVLRKQMWVQAEYCGVEILTYALMINHYHILLRVPKRHKVSDSELLRLYALYNPTPTLAEQKTLEAVKLDMAKDGRIAKKWREKQLKQMFDVSQFNKLLKQNFSIWYNATHDRVGTLWSERFKSLLIEDGEGLRIVGAYIDLNCVRAHLVKDPKDYRFCGYAQAIAGYRPAQEGLKHIYHCDFAKACESCRCLMFAMLSEMKERKAPLNLQEWKEFVQTQGKLPLSVVLRSQVRYFVDGVILGSEAYVREKGAGHSSRLGWKPSALAEVTTWTGLHVFSGMKSRLWG